MASSNFLQSDFKCPKCGTAISCGIGFRAGEVSGISYKLGDKITWTEKRSWPQERPDAGCFKTIGYFECENLRCPTWSDCFPEVQEVLITIKHDIISELKPVSYKPADISFFVFSPDEEV